MENITEQDLINKVRDLFESIKHCPRCLFDSTVASFKTADSQCEYCDIHDELEKQSDPNKLRVQISKISKSKAKYNCLIGISGGLDSATLLWLVVKEWNLRPLVIHFDNGWNTPEAEHNMKALVGYLNVDFIRYSVNKEEYDAINNYFVCNGLPDADIPNDIAMTKLMYDTAHKYGIKYILNGHDFRQEGSTPKGWTYMDAEYIRSVYGKKIQNYPLFTFKDQLLASIRGIKQVRPFHSIVDRITSEIAMKEDVGFKDYGGKHNENIYTAYVGSKLLPEKFGIDKRIVYLSAQVRSGLITKSEARYILKAKPQFDTTKLGKREREILWMAGSDIRDRSEFKRYNFKRWRPVIWILMKTKVVPYTFYKKYCF